MSNKGDLRQAIGALKVHEALKIQGLKKLEAPVFKTPTPPNPVSAETQVTNATLVENITQDAKPSQVVTTTQDQSPTPVRISTEVAKVSEDTNTSLDREVSPVENASQVVQQATGQITIPRSSQPRRATGQDASVTTAADCSSKLRNGYTRLPNSILMDIVSGDLSKAEIKILLLLARLTISYQRKTVPLSKSVLERMTGIQGGVALPALRTLEGRSMITRVPGDPCRPTEVGLVFDWANACLDSTSAPSSARQNGTSYKNESQDAKPTQVALATPDVKTSLVASVSWVEKAPHFKDNKNIKTISSLSPQSEKLTKFFDELKPMKKRESELREYQGLRSDFSDADIADCVEYVVQKGVPAGDGGFAPCHSPMAYLAKAITAVLIEVRLEREKARLRSDREAAAAVEQRREQEESEREQQEWEIKERAFDRAFPGEDRQREVIAELCRGMPFRPDGKAAKTLGIGKWWDGLGTNEQKAWAT